MAAEMLGCNKKCIVDKLGWLNILVRDFLQSKERILSFVIMYAYLLHIVPCFHTERVISLHKKVHGFEAIFGVGN